MSDRAIHIRPADPSGFDVLIISPLGWNGADRHGLRTHKSAARAAASMACVYGLKIVDETAKGGAQ
jgi:hypothetical protein